jgi:anthranilate phosphoribosyltransferase
MLDQLLTQLAASQHLTPEQICRAVALLVEESVPAPAKAEFLSRLAQKGETADELAAFVHELRGRAIEPPLDPQLRSEEILDVVGTGGDRSGTFNISTTVALLAAAAGVRVAKHGNRAGTSLAGSADVLEALGIPIQLEPEQAVRALREHHFAFFFAPKYHPAFRHIAPARKLCAARGQGTLFNFLGPLLNPARPSAMLVGVSRPDLCQPLARVLQSLGVRRAMVVCGAAAQTGGQPFAQPMSKAAHVDAGRDHGTGQGADQRGDDANYQGQLPLYLDEISPLGPTAIAEFYQERALAGSTLSPDFFPLQPMTLQDLRGGDAATNAALVRRLLAGQDRGPRRDAVLLNAAAALWVAGRTRSLTEGWDLAAEVIDSGAALRKLTELSRQRS